MRFMYILWSATSFRLKKISRKCSHQWVKVQENIADVAKMSSKLVNVCSIILGLS